MKRLTIEDFEYVQYITMYKEIYPWVANDIYVWNETKVKLYLINEKIYFLAPEKDGEKIGFYVFIPQSENLYELHGCILPQYWGEDNKQAYKEVEQFMFKETPCTKLIIGAPEDNIRLIKFAEKRDFKLMGILNKCFLRNNNFLDLFIYTKDKENENGLGNSIN
jgi:RimJ/RimL family protein N-acetyltransferase